MRRSFILLVLAAAVSCPAVADFQSSHWQFYAAIRGKWDSRAKYAQVKLTRDVYGGSNAGLTDLRIVAAGNREIAYKLLVDESRASVKGYYPAMLNRSTVPGKYYSFDLDLGKPGIRTNRVDIETPSHNFTRRVEIGGSDDGLHWAVLRTDGYIFDFSRDYHALSLTVKYPQSTFRYIRVKIWGYGQRPIEITGASMARQIVQPPREERLYKGAGSVTQNAAERSTDVLLDMKQPGLPISRIVVLSPSRNYNRLVEIAGSADRKDWTDYGSGQILNYDTPGLKGRQSEIPCRTAGLRYLRVRVRNYDDRPISVSKVVVYGLRHRVFFPYEQKVVAYRLYYGNPEAEAPTYDIEEIFKYLSHEKTNALALGPSVKNADFVMPIATKPWLEHNPWMLWVVLVVAVVLLGLLTIRSILASKQPPAQ